MSSCETVLISENETLKSDSLSHIFPKIIPQTITTTTTTIKQRFEPHVVHFLFLHPTGLVCREDKGPKTDLHFLLLLTQKTHACSRAETEKLKKAIYTDFYLPTVHPTGTFFFVCFLPFSTTNPTQLPSSSCAAFSFAPGPTASWTTPHIEVPLSGSLPYPKLGPGPVGW